MPPRRSGPDFLWMKIILPSGGGKSRKYGGSPPVVQPWGPFGTGHHELSLYPLPPLTPALSPEYRGEGVDVAVRSLMLTTDRSHRSDRANRRVRRIRAGVAAGFRGHRRGCGGDL